jgi:two-component system sensor histidine kinase AlgZ
LHGIGGRGDNDRVASINQTGTGIRLPNFCNLGVMLRALVAVNLLVVGAAAVRSTSLAGFVAEVVLLAAFVEPVLIVSLGALCLARRWLHAIGYAASIAVLAVFEVALAWGVSLAAAELLPGRPAVPFPLVAFVALFATGCTLVYFDLRSRALAPAIAEARIQALQARIRPHFLFNSINAALAFIRSDPRRAEQALEDLADLFRVLMADNRTLAPIANEIELARKYLEIETLRLGERLRVTWKTERMPADALVPALVLQPLVENAVYHGIEPELAGGEVSIEIGLADGQLVMALANPYSEAGNHVAGNRMAIANIRERLQLHFDAEASMKSEVSGGTYRVEIRIPYITAPA